MPVSVPIGRARRWEQIACGGLAASILAACATLQPPAPPPPAPPAVAAPAPAPVPLSAPEPATPPPEQADAADRAARQLLAYDEKLRQMSPLDVTSEVARLGTQVAAADPPVSPDVVLQLALALAQQHNPGDLARAANLLDAIVLDTSPERLPYQPLARLLAGRIAEERRLEDELERQMALRRDTQRTIQQLTEKLEALKAIERSMTARPAPAPGSGSGAEAPPQPKAP